MLMAGKGAAGGLPQLGEEKVLLAILVNDAGVELPAAPNGCTQGIPPVLSMVTQDSPPRLQSFKT